MKSDRKRSSGSLYRPFIMADKMIINSRPPVFALTTALSCGFTAVVLLFQGAWEWCVVLTVLSASMGIWQVRIVFHSPFLTVHESIATRYRESEDETVFLLSELKIVHGNLATGLAFFLAALVGMSLVFIGLSAQFEEAVSLSLNSTQRLLVIMSGVWFSGTAFAIAHLDFPRRKLILGDSSTRSEEMRKVGLGNYGGIAEKHGNTLPTSHRDEPTR